MWIDSFQLWQKDFKGSYLWRNDFSPSLCPNYCTPSFCFQRSTQSLLEAVAWSPGKKSHVGSHRHLPCTSKNQRAFNGHTLERKLTVKKYWGKENLGRHTFQWLNPFWRCVNSMEDCWGLVGVFGFFCCCFFGLIQNKHNWELKGPMFKGLYLDILDVWIRTYS